MAGQRWSMAAMVARSSGVEGLGEDEQGDSSNAGGSAIESQGRSLPPTPSGSREGALRAAVASGVARAAAARELVARRASRPGVVTAGVEPDGVRGAKALTSVGAEKAWRAAMVELYGAGYRVASWTVAEKTLMKRLVVEYGEGVVGEMVRVFVSTWRVRCERQGFSGVPGVKLLWALRANLHGEATGVAQMGTRRPGRAAQKQAKMNSDEFNAAAAAKSEDVGW